MPPSAWATVSKSGAGSSFRAIAPVSSREARIIACVRKFSLSIWVPIRDRNSRSFSRGSRRSVRVEWYSLRFATGVFT